MCLSSLTFVIPFYPEVSLPGQLGTDVVDLECEEAPAQAEKFLSHVSGRDADEDELVMFRVSRLGPVWQLAGMWPRRPWPSCPVVA